MSNELFEELFLAVDSSDWKKLAEIFDAEIVYERPGYDPIVGLERLLQFYRSERVIAGGKHQIEHAVVDGNYGACWGRFVGVKKDGSQVDELFADVYTFNEGKIRARRTHFYRPAV
jgi:ketosteroid isomerase-like protein